jgi:hypothetical protein
MGGEVTSRRSLLAARKSTLCSTVKLLQSDARHQISGMMPEKLEVLTTVWPS